MPDLQIAPSGVVLFELQPMIVVVFCMVISDFANCNSVLEILYLLKYEGTEIPIIGNSTKGRSSTLRNIQH